MYRVVRAGRRIIALMVDECAGLRRCYDIPPAWPQRMEWKSHEKYRYLDRREHICQHPCHRRQPRLVAGIRRAGCVVGPVYRCFVDPQKWWFGFLRCGHLLGQWPQHGTRTYDQLQRTNARQSLFGLAAVRVRFARNADEHRLEIGRAHV